MLNNATTKQVRPGPKKWAIVRHETRLGWAWVELRSDRTRPIHNKHRMWTEREREAGKEGCPRVCDWNSWLCISLKLDSNSVSVRSFPFESIYTFISRSQRGCFFFFPLLNDFLRRIKAIILIIYPLGEVELRVEVGAPMAFGFVVAQFGLKGQSG